MTRRLPGLALSLVVAGGAAGCKDEPVTFTDAAPGGDAPTGIDAEGEARCGDGVRVAGEVCFRLGQTFVTENPPHAARLADIDGDEDLDLYYFAGQEMRYHANADGTFPSAFAVGFVNESVASVEARDLDGDGRDDLVIGEWNQETVWRSGGVAPTTHVLAGSMATPTDLRDSVLANLDGIGRPEAVVLHEDRLRVGVIGNDLSLTAGPDLVLEPPHYSLVAGRVDGDTRDDVLILGFATLLLVRGNDARILATPELVETDFALNYIVGGDHDGDGALDLFTSVKSEVLQLRGNRDGTFQASESTGLFGERSYALGNIDGDADDDLLAVDANGVLHVRLGGDGLMRTSVEIPIWADTLAVSGDLNGDGLPEIVASDGEGELVTLLISDP